MPCAFWSSSILASQIICFPSWPLCLCIFYCPFPVYWIIPSGSNTSCYHLKNNKEPQGTKSLQLEPYFSPPLTVKVPDFPTCAVSTPLVLICSWVALIYRTPPKWLLIRSSFCKIQRTLDCHVNRSLSGV